MKAFLLSLVLLVPVSPLSAESSFFRFLQASAHQGEAKSQFILALAYRDGWEGTVKTGSIAARWRDLAAELGDEKPSLVFGLLEKEKERVGKNEAEALKWLELAAGRGDDYARVILGDILLEGDGVPSDWRSGVEWMRKSANAGFAPAQFRLGLVYLVGDESLPKNKIEALAWFIAAAEAGSRCAEEFRDEQTQLLGLEAARLAVKRSRVLRDKNGSAVREPSGVAIDSHDQPWGDR